MLLMEDVAGQIENQFQVSKATVVVRRFDWRQPTDAIVYSDETSYFDMCLTPRPSDARGSYVGHFSPSSFEPLGQLMFVPVDLPLRARASQGRQRALQCFFNQDAFGDLDISWNEKQLRETLHVASRSIRISCARIVAEMNQPGFASEAVIESLTTIIAVDLVRYFSEKSVNFNTVRGGLQGWRLRRIRECIYADGPPPTLEQLSALCGLSVRHLMRAFRKETGQTIGDAILEARIIRAKQLLELDTYSVKEIAGLLGFSQPPAFSTAFRKATGERPRDYRARVQAERRGRFVSGIQKSVH